jgi:type II secretory pathway component PulM
MSAEDAVTAEIVMDLEELDPHEALMDADDADVTAMQQEQAEYHRLWQEVEELRETARTLHATQEALKIKASMLDAELAVKRKLCDELEQKQIVLEEQYKFEIINWCCQRRNN